MSETYDAIVIGAGVIGAAIGLELARSGRRVLNVDRLPAAGYGSTGNSCAIIRVHYSTLDGTALAYDSYFDWKGWADYLGAPDERGLAEFRDCGCLVMKTEQNGRLTRIVDTVSRLNIPFEEWDAHRIRQALPIYDLKRYWPARRMGDPAFATPAGGEIDGGVFFPTAGYVNDPQLASHNLQRAAEAAGGRFLFNRTVVAIPVANGRVQGVELDDGTRIPAPVVVNVAGPHSGRVNALVGAERDMTIATRPIRQEVVHVDAPDGFDVARSGLVVSDSDIACYVRPETGNHILVGSEDPDCDPREMVDPDGFDRNLSEQAVTQAYRFAQRVPSLKVAPRPKGVVDLYDVSDDWIPIYDRSCIDGFFMAIGTSGNQFKNAPGAGRLMARLIDHVENGGNHDAQAMPFRLKHFEHTVDTATFSRRRTINPDSSFSVLG